MKGSRSLTAARHVLPAVTIAGARRRRTDFTGKANRSPSGRSDARRTTVGEGSTLMRLVFAASHYNIGFMAGSKCLSRFPLIITLTVIYAALQGYWIPIQRFCSVFFTGTGLYVSGLIDVILKYSENSSFFTNLFTNPFIACARDKFSIVKIRIIRI